ncbi:MAG: TIGR01212 family radical SAM protein [Clostridia bacterium]|nr:TIGR01212 family radical SAM protein [Clostridia bacterium]
MTVENNVTGQGSVSQAARNPFPFSDSNKRYHTYDYYLRRTFGGKCAKIPLDAGFTCPNIDGRCGVGGCIYCSGRGSGDFACTADVPLREQYERTRLSLSKKWSVERCIPYFQAHTNTYAPFCVLRSIFAQALDFPGVVGMNIATRADCLPEDTVSLLAELAERTTLTVELGLQSVHDVTAQRINRGHTYAQFLDGYGRLGAASPRISRCVHLIFGLPGEDDDMMLQTVRSVARLRPEQIKIHLLHVLRGTVLGDMYERGEYVPLTREKYISLVVQALTLLPPSTVVGRLTGDGMGEALLAPEWSRKKVTVLNDIDKELYRRNLWQGCACEI